MYVYSESHLFLSHLNWFLSRKAVFFTRCNSYGRKVLWQTIWQDYSGYWYSEEVELQKTNVFVGIPQKVWPGLRGSGSFYLEHLNTGPSPRVFRVATMTVIRIRPSTVWNASGFCIFFIRFRIWRFNWKNSHYTLTQAFRVVDPDYFYTETDPALDICSRSQIQPTTVWNASEYGIVFCIDPDPEFFRSGCQTYRNLIKLWPSFQGCRSRPILSRSVSRHVHSSTKTGLGIQHILVLQWVQNTLL